MNTEKFYVMRMYSTCAPSVDFDTDNEQDARDYARIMSHKNPSGRYAVGRIEILVELPATE